jgi:hypothetical protein
MPRTPSASDKGNPEKSGMMNSFDNHSAAGSLSIFTILLVCHPKWPTTWIPTLYSGCLLSITLQKKSEYISL